MKINRFLGLAAIALMIVGALSAVSLRAFAQTAPPAAQTQPTAAPAVGLDADQVQEQTGDQSAPDLNAAGAETAEAPDGAAGQSSAGEDAHPEEPDTAAPAGQAKLSVDAAKSAALAANPGASVVTASLDDENGALVYSVTLSTGGEVKVDANSGAILPAEAGETD